MKILILGAGISGMTAALELKKRGYQVEIIEGRKIAGGRVQTLRKPQNKDFFVDLGASRIPIGHRLTRELISKYKLELIPFTPQNNLFLHQLNGKNISTRDYQKIPINDFRIRLRREEKAFEHRIFSKTLIPVINQLGDPKKVSWPNKEFERLDWLTYREYLSSIGFSESISDLLNVGWDNNSPMSLLELIRQITLSISYRNDKISGGMDQLPLKMAKDLDGLISYGHKIQDITTEEGAYVISTTNDGLKRTFKGNVVFNSLPLTVLRTLTSFLKNLPQEKQKTIQELNYWNAAKSVTLFEDDYWSKKGLNGFAITDQPSEFYAPNFNQLDGKHKGLLVGYFRNASANEILRKPAEERNNFIYNQIRRLFPNTPSPIEEPFIKIWKEDPYSKGAYSMCTKGQLTTIQKNLYMPEKNMYFIGEHASSYHGWIEGAIQSALRAVENFTLS